jgi:hypothetical protein
MLVLIDFLLQNTNLVSVLCKNLTKFGLICFHQSKTTNRSKREKWFKIDDIINSHITLIFSTITDSMRTKTCVNPHTIKKAVVDTHDDSVDTVDWFRVCIENV